MVTSTSAPKDEESPAHKLYSMQRVEAAGSSIYLPGAAAGKAGKSV